MSSFRQNRFISILMLWLFIHASIVSASICDSRDLSGQDVEQGMTNCHDMQHSSNVDNDVDSTCQHCDYFSCHSIFTIANSPQSALFMTNVSRQEFFPDNYSEQPRTSIFHPPRT